MSGSLRLLGIQLSNFGVHRDFECTFSEGLTVIKGRNGTGKSTLLQGVFFCFFGVSAVDGKAADIPTTGEKNCVAQMLFDLNGARLDLCRTLKDASISYAGEEKPIATGHTAVNEWVERNLGVSQKVFMQLTYAAQTETAAIMSIGATALNRMVENIAQAYFITLVEKKSSEFSLAADFGLKGMETPMDIGELHVKLTQAEIEQTSATVAHKLAEETQQSAHTSMLEFRPIFVEKTAAAKRKSQLSDKLPDLNKDIGQYEAARERALSDIAKVTATQDDLNTAVAARDAASAEHKRLSEAMSKWQAYEQNKLALETWVTRHTDVRAYIQENIDKWIAADKKRTETRQAEDAAKGPADAAYRRYEEACEAVRNATCITCKRVLEGASLETAKAAVAEAEEAMNKANDEYMRCQNEAKAAAQEFKQLDSNMPTQPQKMLGVWEEKQRELKELEADAPKVVLKATLQEAMDRVSEKSTAIAQIKKQLSDRDDYQRDFERAERRLTEAKEQLGSVKAEIDAIGEIDLTALTARHAELSTKDAEATTALAQAAATLKSAGTTVEAFKAEIEKSERLTRERAALERRKSNFGGLTKYLRENRETFMDEMWNQLMALTSQFVSNVTDGKITAILRTPDGEFAYVEEGAEKAYSRLAGGFKAVAGVGLRIALASLLPAGVSIVVLDEPSSELRDDLAASLASALRATDRQILLVTHRVGEEFASDQVIALSE